MNESIPITIANRDQFIYQHSERLAQQLLALYKGSGEKGALVLIYGPCFSGKTLTLILLGRILLNNCILFNMAQPAVDRPGDVFDGYIQSRNGDKLPAVSYSTEQEIGQIFVDKKIVLVNEFQFTSEALQEKFINTSLDFVSHGGFIIMAGLFYSSLRSVFPFSKRIMQSAVTSFELKAICDCCGKPDAIYSQRLINGKPASAKTPLLLSVSDSVSYVPRCEKCHIVNP